MPFYLRTGKAMADDAPHRSRCASGRRRRACSRDIEREPNELVLELTDAARISVDLRAKRPGPDMELAEATLRLDLAEDLPDDEPLEAYERLLLDVLRGDQTLFTRSDEVDRLWQVCEPVLDAPPEPQPYEQGSWGPQAALDLAGPRLAAGGSGAIA